MPSYTYNSYSPCNGISIILHKYKKKKHARTYTKQHAHIHEYIHTHTRTHTRTHAYTHTYIHTHKHITSGREATSLNPRKRCTSTATAEKQARHSIHTSKHTSRQKKYIACVLFWSSPCCRVHDRREAHRKAIECPKPTLCTDQLVAPYRSRKISVVRSYLVPGYQQCWKAANINSMDYTACLHNQKIGMTFQSWLQREINCRCIQHKSSQTPQLLMTQVSHHTTAN